MGRTLLHASGWGPWHIYGTLQGADGARGGAENAIWNLPAVYPNHVWSFDFMTDRTVDGVPFRILNIVDEYTRVCIESYVARNIGAHRVQLVLERCFAKYGKPKYLRSDNGREFIADVLGEWLAVQGVASAFVEKGSPQQNAFIERFNGTMRRELLNGEEFHDLLEARVVIAQWVEIYNTIRPTPWALWPDSRQVRRRGQEARSC